LTRAKQHRHCRCIRCSSLYPHRAPNHLRCPLAPRTTFMQSMNFTTLPFYILRSSQKTFPSNAKCRRCSSKFSPSMAFHLYCFLSTQAVASFEVISVPVFVLVMHRCFSEIKYCHAPDEALFDFADEIIKHCSISSSFSPNCWMTQRSTAHTAYRLSAMTQHNRRKICRSCF